MKKIVKKCIAAGILVAKKDKAGKLVKEIAATVYEEKLISDESSSGSAAEGKKSVVLKYKNFEYTEDVLAPLGYKEIASEGALIVPGLNGNEDVKLEAPITVRYSRTKSFERNSNTVVYATLRYDM